MCGFHTTTLNFVIVLNYIYYTTKIWDFFFFQFQLGQMTGREKSFSHAKVLLTNFITSAEHLVEAPHKAARHKYGSYLC